MTTFRFCSAPNAPYVYVRLEDEDGRDITVEDAADYILGCLDKAGQPRLPWMKVQQVDVSEAKIRGMMRWHRQDVFGAAACPLVEPLDILRSRQS